MVILKLSGSKPDSISNPKESLLGKLDKLVMKDKTTLNAFRQTWKLAVATLLLGCFHGAAAHHPIQGKFDPEQSATMAGVVTKVDWRSPHVHVFMNVNEGNNVVNWAVELENPYILIANGWDDNSLQPGDMIRVSGMKARNGSRQVWGDEVVMAETGRSVYAVSDTSPPKPLAKRPVPRWPDNNRPVLGASPGGVGGLWSYPTEKVLVEDGVDVTMDEYGQLENIADAGKVAPMQDWALARYVHRQERNLMDDPMYLDCKPPGGPRQYQSDLGFQLIEDRKNDRIFVLLGSGNRNYRIIHMDGRNQVGLVTGDDDNPLFYGRSTGSWAGDTLVVETTGFNEGFWFTNGGLPHTDMLTMEERFTRSDFDTLHYEVTINDPGAYTRPWTASWDLSWVGGAGLPFSLCQHNRQ